VDAGVCYGSATVEASTCANREIFVLGGGNSAGQAALFLDRFASRVHLLFDKGSLDASMSRYLIDRIEQTPNIVLHPFSTVARCGWQRPRRVDPRPGDSDG
jgi:thioredoxin reductase (NADPH)